MSQQIATTRQIPTGWLLLVNGEALAPVFPEEYLAGEAADAINAAVAIEHAALYARVTDAETTAALRLDFAHQLHEQVQGLEHALHGLDIALAAERARADRLQAERDAAIATAEHVSRERNGLRAALEGGRA